MVHANDRHYWFSLNIVFINFFIHFRYMHKESFKFHQKFHLPRNNLIDFIRVFCSPKLPVHLRFYVTLTVGATNNIVQNGITRKLNVHHVSRKVGNRDFSYSSM